MLLRARSGHRPGSFRQRLGIVLYWPLGLAHVTWRYLWRTTVMRRREEQGSPQDVGPPLPDEVDRDGIQGIDDGVGRLLRRRYAVRVSDAGKSPAEVINELAADPNAAAPAAVAVFVKTEGAPGEMAVNDEYVVRMPGPWDGPVRVVCCSPTSFRLATMEGHLEAGQIEFRARCEGEELVFEIESWARPGDRLSNLLYNHLLLAKEIQLNLWTETCLGVARNSGGRLRGGVQVTTWRVDGPVSATG